MSLSEKRFNKKIEQEMSQEDKCNMMIGKYFRLKKEAEETKASIEALIKENNLDIVFVA